MTRRIIVALDESAPSLAALESATRLAAELSAEIRAIFVEDTDLFSAAGLPGSLAVTFDAGAVVPLDQEVLVRSLRMRARRLREDVARIADTYRVAWRFEIIRGRVSEELLRIAGEGEIIAIGAASTADRRGAFGSNAQAIVERARCAVLVVVRRSAPPERRILVLSAGSSQARQMGEGLAHMTGAALSLQDAPANRLAALDLLMRVRPSYLVIDRATLAHLKMPARELAEQIKVEGLIVTD